MRAFFGLATALLMVAPAAAEIVVHRDPGCGCCEKWARQVQAQFKDKVRIVNDAKRAALQKHHHIPADLGSCHTAVIDGYAFEGHVPIADMKRLLAQRPKGVKGLAVAGMPMGSLGMEVSGMAPQRYEVIAFGPSGRKVFARH